MIRSKLIEELKRDEGVILHEYKDHLGYSTLGIGRLIDQRKGGGISMSEAEYLLSNDIDRIEKELDGKIPWWRMTNEDQQRALCNMAFQLGIGGLLKFRSMLQALNDGDGARAAEHALDSLWASQTPARAKRIAELLRG